MDEYDKARSLAETHLENNGRKNWSYEERDKLVDLLMHTVSSTGGKWSKFRRPHKPRDRRYDGEIIEGLGLRNMTIQQIATRAAVSYELSVKIVHRLNRDGTIKSAGKSGRETVYSLA